MSSTHIIRRQFLDVKIIGSESDGFAVLKSLPDICQNWLVPALDDVFERIAPAREHWTIERLEIDAGAFDPEHLERGLVEAVTQSIERYLREHALQAGLSSAATGVAERLSQGAPPVSGAIGRRSEVRSLLEAFSHFLATGVLPWWFHLPAGTTLEDLIRESWRADGRPEQFARSVSAVMGQGSVLARLVRQFSKNFLEALLAAISQQGAASVREILAELARHDVAAQTLEPFVEQVWETAFAAALSGEQLTPDTVVAGALNKLLFAATLPQATSFERIARLWPGAKPQGNRVDATALSGVDARHAIPKTPAHRAEPGEADFHLDLGEGVYVACAGAVLLHPFLPQLFETLGIARDDKLLQPERALGLLHYLATGQRFAPEYDLLLPKLLCNLPFDVPVHSRVELTMAEEQEADALVAAVIRHWDALGDTSIDGLRGSFLVRRGKLSRRGGEDVLQVEARSFDILLDRLPWGIGLIQLPWMEKILWVEWRV